MMNTTNLLEAKEKNTMTALLTIEDVCKFLHLPVDHSVKAVAYTSDKGLILCFVRGDHDVNEIKVINATGVTEVDMAPAEMLAAAGTVGGFMGPVGLDPKKAIVVIDSTVMNMHNICCGANKVDTHYINVNPKTDFVSAIVADIRLAKAGDPCPRCGGKLSAARGIEVGQVFKLFTKYSEPMKATYLDINGQEQPIYMGSYGIGVGRTIAAVIEQHNDKGLNWSKQLSFCCSLSNHCPSC